MTKRLLIIGLGYSASRVADRFLTSGWSVTATTRTAEKASAIAETGIEPLLFTGLSPSEGVRRRLANADALLLSAAPDMAGDPFLRHHGGDLADFAGRWVGYLSTVGVYGDHGGAWVDETTRPLPGAPRSIWRIAAENAWCGAAEDRDFSLDIFRLAGIYGPGRNVFRRLRAGTARAIVKPGQVFNRIHVDDIASVVTAGAKNPGRPGAARIVNVADAEPAPPQDTLWHAADIAGLARPSAIDFKTADLPDMARSFYSECKRVRTVLQWRNFGVRLVFPTYREGLSALWASGEADIRS